MSIRCGHCGAVNEDGDRKCHQCGRQLMFAPADSAPGDNVACPGCNHHNIPEARFCQACGAALFSECPKCGSQFRVGPRHCTSCGIDLARYADAARALAQAREHLDAQRFEQAIAAAEGALEGEYLRDELREVRASAHRSGQTVERLKTEADALIKVDRHEQAQARLHEALELDPAREELRDILRSLPDGIRRRDIRRMNQMAQSLINQGQYAEAAEILTEAMKLDPANDDIQALLSETIERPKQDTVSQLVMSAQRLMDVGRYQAAEIKLREALRLDPSRGDIAVAIDDLPDKIRRRDLDTSLSAAREAIGVRNFSVVMENCAKVLLLDADNSDAADMKRQAEQMRADYAERLSRAREDADSEKYDLAIEQFAAIVRDYPWDKAVAEEHDEFENRGRKVSRLRLRACQQASEYEQHGAFGKALDTWIKLVKLKSDDEEAVAQRDRLRRRIRRRRIVRGLAIVIAVVIVVGGACSVYDGLEDRHRLDQVRKYIERNEFAAARTELDRCGWFAFGKADLATELTRVEFDWNVDEGGRLSSGNGQDLEKAARHYLRSNELQGGSAAVAEGLKTVKAAWLGAISDSRRAQEYEQAERQAQAAVVVFGDDASFTRVLSEVRNIRNSQPLEWDMGDGVMIKFVSIPAGTFVMGSPATGGGAGSGSDESPRRVVAISRQFYMGATEVTQAQYKAVMGAMPRRSDGPAYPARQISWNDADEFCRLLSVKMNRKVRLASEAEWEYACRAGSTTPFHYGRTISTDQANYDGKYVFDGGKRGLTRDAPLPVGSFPANVWGLHDMHGNVQEWCGDWYGPYPAGAAKDPTGPAEGTKRVLRGGYWDSAPWACRSASREKDIPSRNLPAMGFRVVLELAEAGS